MLLTSRPAPLLLDRVRFTPGYGPDPSIRSRSPSDVVNPYSPPPDVNPPVLPAPESTPTQATSPHELHRPVDASPLRLVTDAPEPPPSERQRRLTIANLGTPGGRMVGFPRTHQRSLPTPEDVKVKRPDIISVPPLPALPTSPAPPRESVPTEPQTPSVPPDTPNRANQALPSIVLDETTPLTSSDHARLSPVFDHETSAAEALDSPSVYSPTPPTSSVPPTDDLLEASTGWPNLADANLAVIDVGHHPFVEQFSGEELSNEPPTGEQPRDKDRSASTPMDALRDVRRERGPDRRRGGSADARRWWGRVTIVAEAVTSNVAKVLEKKTHATVAKLRRDREGRQSSQEVMTTGQS